MNKQSAIAQTLWDFFNKFDGINAYRKGSTFNDDNPQIFPLLLYPVDLYDEFEQGFLQVSIYDNIGNWTRLDKFADALTTTIGNGLNLKLDKGYLTLFKGSPWVQQQQTENETLALYFVIQCNYNI